MTFSLPHPSERATGVKTDGVGQKTTAHLNLTRTMADAEQPRGPRIQRENARRWNMWERDTAGGRVPFAGKASE